MGSGVRIVFAAKIQDSGNGSSNALGSVGIGAVFREFSAQSGCGVFKWNALVRHGDLRYGFPKERRLPVEERVEFFAKEFFFLQKHEGDLLVEFLVFENDGFRFGVRALKDENEPFLSIFSCVFSETIFPEPSAPR